MSRTDRVKLSGQQTAAIGILLPDGGPFSDAGQSIASGHRLPARKWPEAEKAAMQAAVQPADVITGDRQLNVRRMNRVSELKSAPTIFTPLKCKNEYLVLALREETAVQAVGNSIVWAFRRLKKPRYREMSARGYALHNVCPQLSFSYDFQRQD